MIKNNSRLNIDGPAYDASRIGQLVNKRNLQEFGRNQRFYLLYYKMKIQL